LFLCRVCHTPLMQRKRAPYNDCTECKATAGAAPSAPYALHAPPPAAEKESRRRPAGSPPCKETRPPPRRGSN
jgi:hypothetical protein